MRLQRTGGKRGLLRFFFSHFKKTLGEIQPVPQTRRVLSSGGEAAAPGRDPTVMFQLTLFVSELVNDESIFFFRFDETQGPTRSFHPSSFTKCISPALLPPFPHVSRSWGVMQRLGIQDWRQADEGSNPAPPLTHSATWAHC